MYIHLNVGNQRTIVELLLLHSSAGNLLTVSKQFDR